MGQLARRRGGAVILLLSVGLVAAASAQYRGWDIPEGGRNERSPLKPGGDVVRRGNALFQSHCVRCHGPEGRGNGPDSDHAADLTDSLRTDLNPEGVLFYKVWNGHAIQLRGRIVDMPAFQVRLSRNDVWAIVEHLKVLRTPAK